YPPNDVHWYRGPSATGLTLFQPRHVMYNSPGPSYAIGQATTLPQAFTNGTLHDHTIAMCQFVRDNNCTIEFDAFGFSIKYFMTRRVLLRCYSTGDLYPVTSPSLIPHAFFVSQHMWHQRLGHPGGEVLRRFVSSNFISCNKEKPSVLCHACQLGRHVRLSFVSSNTYLTDGSLSRYKARLVANGNTQLEGIDVDETFSSVVKPGNIRTVLSLVASRHWLIHQLDVKNAFLHGDLSKTKKYAIEILDRAHMLNCNPSRTPIDTESKLGSDGDPVSDSTLYQILADLVAYSDADWAGFPTTRRSTSGYCVFLSNNLLSWSSKRQPTLFRYSAEAEYRGVANAIAETCWLRNLLRELHIPLSSATLVYCDNFCGKLEWGLNSLPLFNLRF
ncbi:ribonuclease H-like domain-containing protein, partial [Tanacetum coccineum]